MSISKLILLFFAFSLCSCKNESKLHLDDLIHIYDNNSLNRVVSYRALHNQDVINYVINYENGVKYDSIFYQYTDTLFYFLKKDVFEYKADSFRYLATIEEQVDDNNYDCKSLPKINDKYRVYGLYSAINSICFYQDYFNEYKVEFIDISSSRTKVHIKNINTIYKDIEIEFAEIMRYNKLDSLEYTLDSGRLVDEKFYLNEYKIQRTYEYTNSSLKVHSILFLKNSIIDSNVLKYVLVLSDGSL